MKSLGLNIVGLSDFHGDLHANDAGAVRFQDQQDYAKPRDARPTPISWSRPGRSPARTSAATTTSCFRKTSTGRRSGRTGSRSREQDPVFGKVYHTGSADDVQKMMDAEGAYWYHAHPRTKGTTGYPDLIFDKPWTKSDRYLGRRVQAGHGDGFVGGADVRVAVFRCHRHDEQSVRGSGLRPKYIIADIDTYQKGPEDDLYPNFPVNYLKLDKVPGPDDDWSPVLDRAAQRRLLRDDRGDPDPVVQGRRHWRQTHHRRRRRMDVPAVVRRGCVGRREEDRPPGHQRTDLARSARSSSAFRSTRLAKPGCALPCGTRPATVHSSSRCGSDSAALRTAHAAGAGTGTP